MFVMLFNSRHSLDFCVENSDYLYFSSDVVAWKPLMTKTQKLAVRPKKNAPVII